MVPVPLASAWFSNMIETIWLVLFFPGNAVRNGSGEFYYQHPSWAFNQQLWRLSMQAVDHCIKEEWSEPGARLWPKAEEHSVPLSFPEAV